MDIIQIDDDGRLFISPAIDDWNSVEAFGIDVVIDLDGGLDSCIPAIPNHCVYVYFLINDDEESLPDLVKLWAIARMAAELIAAGHRVLAHCGLGYNRSALIAGLILTESGMTGAQALERVRERRAGALYNEAFAAFLESVGVVPSGA